MDRDGVAARLERGPAVRNQRHTLVIGRVTVDSPSQNAVEVNLRVLVVVHPKLQIMALAVRQRELAAQPDVWSVPLGAYDRAGRAARAETGGAFFPRSHVETGLEPILFRLLRGVTPLNVRLFARCGHDDFRHGRLR